MIIYGSKAKELANEHLTDKCPNCGTQNSTSLHVFQKYAHVFWIPLFPMGKTGVSECAHCKQVLKLKEMPAGLVVAYENLKARTKTPVWTFTGLALLAVIIAAVFISDARRKEKNSQLILTPLAGDVFQVKTKENHYTLYKVDRLQGDSVFMRVNNFEVDRITGIDDLKGKEYSTDVFGVSRGDLTDLFNKGEIIDIDRK